MYVSSKKNKYAVEFFIETSGFAKLILKNTYGINWISYLYFQLIVQYLLAQMKCLSIICTLKRLPEVQDGIGLYQHKLELETGMYIVIDL